MLSQNDRWLRTRPNNRWQDLENQVFIDQTQLANAWLDDHGSTSDEEEGVGSSDEMSDAEGSSNESENETCDEEDEPKTKHNPERISFGSPRATEKGYLGTHLSPNDQSQASRYQDRRTQRNMDHESVRQGANIVEQFLSATHDQDLYRDSIARLSQFFHPSSLEDLGKGEEKFGAARILLEDRNFSRKTFRPYPRSLTPEQLYDALGKQRYPTTTASNSVTSKSKVWTESENCQVERRTIYISNPSRLCAFVLAATASPTQAPALFNFIDRYLKFETSISVQINCVSSARMTLSLHLPFYTFRERSLEDSRQDHENAPLRKCAEIPYMHLMGSSVDLQRPKWICEAQVSLLVSIVDLYGWTAYAFEDTYYKTQEPTLYWDSFCSNPKYYYPDALSSGSLDSTRFLDPRVYFLRVFETRINQAYREWRVVVDTLEEIVKKHRPDRIFFQSAGSSTCRDSKLVLQQKYAEWVSSMTAVVCDLSGQISTTLTAWDEFEKRCSKYFPEDLNSPLDTTICHTFSMIKILKDRLDSLSREIAGDQSALSAQLALENTGYTKFVKAFTVICIVMMPMVLDIALFSVQPGVMPFRMDFLAFVNSYFSLALFSCIVWIVSSYWSTLVLFSISAFGHLNSALRAPSRIVIKPTDKHHANKLSGVSTGDGDNSPMDETPQCQKSFWHFFNPEIDVERGVPGTSVLDVVSKHSTKTKARPERETTAPPHQKQTQSSKNAENHSQGVKAHQVADFNHSASRSRGPPIEGPHVDPIGEKPVSPRIVPRAATARLEDQTLDVQRIPWHQGQISQIRADAHIIESGTESSSISSMEEVFDRVRTQWSSAESTEAQIELLESLGRNKPKASAETTGVDSTWQGWLRCEWELPGVVQQLRKSQFDEVQTLLGDFVTITGGAGGMECSTCAQFLEKTWKKSGLLALKVLSQGVALLDHNLPVSSRPTSSQNLEIHATNTHILLRVQRGHQDAKSFVDAVVWICTAARVNAKTQSDASGRSRLQMSKASQLMLIKSSQSQAVVYGLEDLTECSDQELGPQAICWTGLFRSGVVAYHSGERQWGAGLEISFDMMIHLSGVENVYNIDGGLIFVGFSTALVPTSRDETTNTVQWHFEEVNGTSGEQLRPSSLPSILGGWYKTQNVNMLRTSKCFVGWYARANILLGTRQLVINSPNRLNWSVQTKEHNQSARMEGFGANGQLGFTVGPINAALQLVRTWRFHSNVQHFYRHEQYSMALRLGRGNVAGIIDSESKQVWLVPMLSLVLHLCHRYFQEVNRNARTENPIPFANPSPDGALEATRVLEPKGEVLVFGDAGDPDAENLRQLFLRINTNLLNAAESRERSKRKTLFASELMAMITEPGRGSPLKKIKATANAESWVGLLARLDFVGVCANIGHLIEPDPPSTNTCICSELPGGRYLLAAHMRCLDALSQREGDNIRNSQNTVCRLGDKVFWNMGRLHWTSCPAGGHDPIWNEEHKVFQKISRREKGKCRYVLRANGLPVLQQHLPEDGVVVFGGEPTNGLLQNLRKGESIY